MSSNIWRAAIACIATSASGTERLPKSEFPVRSLPEGWLATGDPLPTLTMLRLRPAVSRCTPLIRRLAAACWPRSQQRADGSSWPIAVQGVYHGMSAMAKADAAARPARLPTPPRCAGGGRRSPSFAGPSIAARQAARGNFLRPGRGGGVPARNETLWNMRPSLRSEARELHHLRPLLSLVGDELGKLRRRASERCSP
jgi:hypothetical protein